jgi:hypothetical protein
MLTLDPFYSLLLIYLFYSKLGCWEVFHHIADSILEKFDLKPLRQRLRQAKLSLLILKQMILMNKIIDGQVNQLS